jgi:hypothetical protein
VLFVAAVGFPDSQIPEIDGVGGSSRRSGVSASSNPWLAFCAEAAGFPGDDGTSLPTISLNASITATEAVATPERACVGPIMDTIINRRTTSPRIQRFQSRRKLNMQARPSKNNAGTARAPGWPVFKRRHPLIGVADDFDLPFGQVSDKVE